MSAGTSRRSSFFRLSSGRKLVVLIAVRLRAVLAVRRRPAAIGLMISITIIARSSITTTIITIINRIKIVIIIMIINYCYYYH